MMSKTTTIGNAMKESSHRTYQMLAFGLGILVYFAGMLYGAVRSYSLLANTVDPSLILWATIGIIALELTAVGLPLGIHFWFAPGPQRMAGLGFYAVDLVLIIANSIIDYGRHTGTLLPAFLTAYTTFVLPALPIIMMVAWAVLWMLDPSVRQRLMQMTVQAATHESVLSHMQDATEAIDIADMVRETAEETARAIVAQTLGRTGSSRGPVSVFANNRARLNATSFAPPAINGNLMSEPADMPISASVGRPVPVKPFVRHNGNGHRAVPPLAEAEEPGDEIGSLEEDDGGHDPKA